MTKVARWYWTAAAACVVLVWVMIRNLGIGPGVPVMEFWLLVAGVAFVIPAAYLRRRAGGWALTAFVVGALAALALALGRTVAARLDIYAYFEGVRAAVALLSPSLGLATITLHLLAKRPSHPPCERDVPIGLAVFALAQVLGYTLAFFLLVATVPRVG